MGENEKAVPPGPLVGCGQRKREKLRVSLKSPACMNGAMIASLA